MSRLWHLLLLNYEYIVFMAGGLVVSSSSRLNLRTFRKIL